LYIIVIIVIFNDLVSTAIVFNCYDCYA
jgi:hypothetical protein